MLFVYHSYVIRMSLVCARLSSVCHSYITRMSLVFTRMSLVCQSYVLACHPYDTRLWFCLEPCTILYYCLIYGRICKSNLVNK